MALPRPTSRLRTSLMLAIVCCTALLAWLSWPQPEPAPGLAVPSLAASLPAVDRIELRQGGRLLTLERRGQLWYLAQHGGYPANSARASALLDGLAGMVLVRRGTGVMETLGLNDPDKAGGQATLVRVLSVAGRGVGSLVLGKREGTGQYVRHANDFQAWLGDRFIDPNAALESWADELILPPGTAGIASAVLEAPDQPPMRLGPAEAASLRGMTFDDVRPTQQSNVEPRGALHCVLTDGTALDVAVGVADGRTWLRLAASGPGGDAINRRVAGWSYAVPDFDATLTRPDSASPSQ